MRAMVLSLSCLLAAVAADAATVVETVVWERHRSPHGATWLAPDRDASFARLRVSHLSPEPLLVPLATVEQPQLGTPFWAIRCQVRCEGVTGPAYLEMWSLFPDGSRYFSRSLASAGPLRALDGTQSWRPLVLPFASQPESPAPSQLVVNLMLPGPGTVEVGPLELVEHRRADDLLLIPGQWFGSRTAGLIGGSFGGLAGLLGAAVGLLATRLAARRLVISALVVMAALGAIATMLGLTALAFAQAWEVWFALLLPGVICCVVPLALLPTIRRRYAELELRRMRALDLG